MFRGLFVGSWLLVGCLLFGVNSLEAFSLRRSSPSSNAMQNAVNPQAAGNYAGYNNTNPQAAGNYAGSNNASFVAQSPQYSDQSFNYLPPDNNKPRLGGLAYRNEATYREMARNTANFDRGRTLPKSAVGDAFGFATFSSEEEPNRGNILEVAAQHRGDNLPETRRERPVVSDLEFQNQVYRGQFYGSAAFDLDPGLVQRWQSAPDIRPELDGKRNR